MFSMEVQRMILFAALALVLVMLWQSWVEFRAQHAPGAAAVAPNTEPAPVPVPVRPRPRTFRTRRHCRPRRRPKTARRSRWTRPRPPPRV